MFKPAVYIWPTRSRFYHTIWRSDGFPDLLYSTCCMVRSDEQGGVGYGTEAPEGRFMCRECEKLNAHRTADESRTAVSRKTTKIVKDGAQ